MKNFFLIALVMLWCITLMAQKKFEITSEESPTLQSISHDPALEATWDVQFSYDATAITLAAGNAGAVYIPTIDKFWTSRWATGVAHQWNSNGTLDFEFTLPFTGTRGMCFDGTVVYHSTATTTVQKVDPVTRTVVGTVSVVGAPNGFRFITYNPDGNSGAGSIVGGNWTAPNLNFYEFSLTGTLLRTITNAVTGVYGLAYDNWSPGGPFLWVWSQGAGAGTPQLIQQMDWASGTYTGVTHDVISDVGLGQTGAIAGGLFITDQLVPGTVTLGGMLQGVPDVLFGYELVLTGPPCPVGAASNPSPADGAIDVPISGNTASWTNGAGTTQVEVWFGEAGNLVQVYNGSPISSFSLAPVEPLNYLTDYGWKIICKNDTCSTPGPTWTFTTVQDPNLNCVFVDDFEGGITAWTITDLGGTPTCIWKQIFPPYPNVYTMPPTSSGGVLAADVDDCGSGSTLNSAAQIGPFDASIYQGGYVKFDQDFNAIDVDDACYVEVSVDGGATWNAIWSQIGVDLRATTEQADMSLYSNQQSAVWIRFRSVQPGWDWWWTIDNVEVCLFDAIPVELTSFYAIADYGVVELSWITATETNNRGFEVQRSSNGNQYESIAFINGHGTTTEPQAYSYTDRSITSNLYSYRLKQIDFDGTFKYSNVINVDVPMLKEFALDQNYPNPFNPSTKITFRLAVDSKVSLKVFDVLGQEVATLVNSNLVAGGHSIDFDASAFNSGVYLYRIEATGNDGSNFVDVKKMILTK
jgi:hypothetical protein